jgi:hypothetical protein
MNTPFSDLGPRVEVPIGSLFLDANNPRVAPEEPIGYADPEPFYDFDLQSELEDRVYEVYKASDLEDAIIAQGWVPIDLIMVWEHPKFPDRHIVVEGNTRTAVLRRIRSKRIEKERKTLARMTKGGRYPAEEVRQQRLLVERIEKIIADTNTIGVHKVLAATPEELEQMLPRLLGVRHIMHSKQWGPYATNLYILSLYERLYWSEHPDAEELALDHVLVKRVAAMVSLGETKTRRNIQAASAFGHFKRKFEDRLPTGGRFTDEDQYFFENILLNKYPQEEFGFSKDHLQLPDESEEALFLWAFSKPRKANDNPNVFERAEDIRLWHEMWKFDRGNHGATSFAREFNVAEPETARPIRRVEAEYLHRKAQQTPIDAFRGLEKSLEELKVDTMVSQAEFLMPSLERIGAKIATYISMMKAAQDENGPAE